MNCLWIVTFRFRCVYASESNRTKDFYQAFVEANARSNFQNDLTQTPDWLAGFEGEDEMILRDVVYELPLVVQFPSEHQYKQHKANNFADIWDQFEKTIWKLYSYDFNVLNAYYYYNALEEDPDTKALTHDTPIDLEVAFMDDIRKKINGKLISLYVPYNENPCTLDR